MRLTALAFASLLTTLPLNALELELETFYELNRPASLAFDPTFCGLWIANESSELVLVTLDGLELQRFGSDLRRIKAVTIEGNNLLVADGFGGFQRLSKTGTPLEEPFRIGTPWGDTEGMEITEGGEFIVVEDEPGHMVWFNEAGEITKKVDGLTLSPPMTEPQGIAQDPRTGHLLVVDDWEGTNSLYEFTEDGTLLATTSLIDYGRDPEGIAIRPSTGTVFIAFDGGARIASFAYTPTGGVSAPPDPAADCMISALPFERAPV